MQQLDQKRKKEIWISIIIIISIMIFCSYLFLKIGFFDKLYHFTRDHEEWELDEFIAVFFATTLAGTVIAIRQLFLMNRLNNALRDSYIKIQHHHDDKIQHEKTLALGSLANGLAHEINNALQPLFGLNEFIINTLEKHNEKDDVQNMLIIMSGAEHAKGIIESVLLFSHKKSLNLDNLEYNTALGDCLKFCKSILPSTTKITVDGLLPEPTNYYIKSSQTALYQIFYNLLNNAVHATQEKGNIIINVSTDKGLSEPEDVLQITIQDDGCGMNEETLNKIFDPFFSTKDISVGTGLGMPTVFALIKQHNGTIAVDSQVNVGTTFTLTFPIYKRDVKGDEHVH